MRKPAKIAPLNTNSPSSTTSRPQSAGSAGSEEGIIVPGCWGHMEREGLLPTCLTWLRRGPFGLFSSSEAKVSPLDEELSDINKVPKEPSR